MANKSKEIVHALYNSLTATDMSDIKEVLLKVYSQLEETKENEPLVNRLVNYIYFTALQQKLHFNPDQAAMIRELSQIGKTAGINGVYRANYGDKTQF